jgi:hypothetical protein
MDKMVRLRALDPPMKKSEKKPRHFIAFPRKGF